MKKYLEMFGLTVLICFSFFLTEKTSDLIKDNDYLMTIIKEKSLELEISSVDAVIKGDEIIPGLSGKIIDIEQSYQVMKKTGIYHNQLLVYKEIEPSISIEENYDKYVVSGNSNKKMVSFIFKVEQGSEINNILNVLDDYQVSANFFIDGKWLEKNYELLQKITSKKHVVGNLGYLNNYEHENNYWIISNIKRNTNQKKYYCYCEEKNENILKKCIEEKQYTILPKVVINANLLTETKKNIEPGSIISVVINNNNLSQLANTIEFVIAKGYTIVNLDTLLDE